MGILCISFTHFPQNYILKQSTYFLKSYQNQISFEKFTKIKLKCQWATNIWGQIPHKVNIRAKKIRTRIPTHILLENQSTPKTCTKKDKMISKEQIVGLLELEKELRKAKEYKA